LDNWARGISPQYPPSPRSDPAGGQQVRERIFQQTNGNTNGTSGELFSKFRLASVINLRGQLNIVNYKIYKFTTPILALTFNGNHFFFFHPLNLRSYGVLMNTNSIFFLVLYQRTRSLIRWSTDEALPPKIVVNTHQNFCLSSDPVTL
jgi:hypothetical protein